MLTYLPLAFVNINNVEDFDENDTSRVAGFNDLVIPDNYRKLLIALVENYTSDGQAVSVPQSMSASTADIDIVRGKGRGLIILLHGPPGSGKTSTAETIAAYTRRPLYSITCGDLGTSPSSVEDGLEQHAMRSQKWGCVLLIDEADVFLTRRDWRDMERNALVSGEFI